MEDHDWNRKAAESELCSQLILATVRAPDTQPDAASNEERERRPPSCATLLPPQTPEQGDQGPTAQAEEYDREKSIHARCCSLTPQISDPAPLIFYCKPERHRRVHCIWFVGPPMCHATVLLSSCISQLAHKGCSHVCAPSLGESPHGTP